MNVLNSGEEKIGTAQDGWKQFLLCHECEQFLNREYEKPFETYWYDTPAIASDLSEGDIIRLSNIDYTRFKLFFLSVLWRMSISTLEELKNISLGPYAERFRKMILEKNAGPDTAFAFTGLVVLGPDGNIFDEIAMTPSRERHYPDRTTIIFMMLGGCEWLFVVNDSMPSQMKNNFLPNALKENGSMNLAVTRYDEKVYNIHDFIERSQRNNLTGWTR